MGLNYKILYKKGTDNTAADALSWRPHLKEDHSAILAISCAQPSWLEDIVSSYNQDEKGRELLQQLAVSPASKPNYALVNGLIRYKNSIWIANDLPLQTTLLGKTL